VLNAAVTHGAVKKAGASFSFEGEKLGVGMENAKNKLKEDKKLLEAIKKKVLETPALEKGEAKDEE